MKTKLLISICFIFFLVSFGFSQSKLSKKSQWSWGKFSDEVDSDSNLSPVSTEILAILLPNTYENITRESFITQSSFIYPNPVRNDEVATILLVPDQSSIYKIGIYDNKGKQQLQLFEGPLEKGKEFQLEINSQKLNAGYSYVKITSSNGYFKAVRLVVIK